MIKNFLLVGLGGGIGSMLRYASGLLINSKYFPYATLAVNIIGSFIIGIVLAMSIKDEGITDQWKLFLATGICGGFTTFSTFAYENMNLLRTGDYLYFGLYAAGSVILGIAIVYVGIFTIKYL